MKFDLAIIGGGPAGYTAAERASAAGLSVVLFEKNSLGGVCLNEGCIPTKSFLYSAKLLDQSKGSSKYGINVQEVTYDLSKIVARKTKIIRKLVAGIKARMVAGGVEFIQGEANAVTATEDTVTVKCNDEEYISKYLFICVGSQTVIPSIPGLSTTDFWTNKEALMCTEIPPSLLVMGGGVIGLEFASFFASMGSKVIIVEMAGEILGGMDREMAALLRTEYEKKGVIFKLKSCVKSVTGNEVSIDTEGELSTLATDKLLLCVGRKPNLSGFEKLLLNQYRGALQVNEFMQTSASNVYACGDITGTPLLAHVAVREAEVAVNHLLGIEDEMSYRAIPGVIYTHPEFAGVGVTEEQLKAQDIPYRVHRLPMSYSGRFVVENEGGSGLCKLILAEDDTVLGVHILGDPASEIITIASMAVEQQLTLEEWKKFVFPHPTVAEILKESMWV